MFAGSYDSALQSAVELAEPIRVQGILGSARAWAILRTIRRFPQTTLVLCPDDDTCVELLADTQALQELFPVSAGSIPPVQMFHFPNWEHSLYSSVTPSLRIRLSRAAVLAKLAERRLMGSPAAESSLLIFTTYAGSLLQTIPGQVMERHSLTLTVGESCGSREQAVLALIEAGYLRVDTVEDQGTFSARGEILDIFAPAWEEPLRIELFDDQVDKIRSFDPATQRTLGNEFRSCVVAPCREVLLNRFTVPLAREKLKAFADDHGIPRSIRDPILENVAEGLLPTDSEGWGAFAYASPESFWGHLPKGTSVLMVDDLTCQQYWDKTLHDEESAYKLFLEKISENRRIVPAPSQRYEALTAAHPGSPSQARIIFSTLELAELHDIPSAETELQRPEKIAGAPSDKLRMKVRLNGDMSGESGRSLAWIDDKLKLWARQTFNVIACAPTLGQADRLKHLLHQRGHEVDCRESSLTSGFRWPGEGLVIFTENEVLGSSGARKGKGSRKPSSSKQVSREADDWAGLQALSDLAPGDPIVHLDHGIGRYQGLVRMNISGAPADFLLLEYAGRDKLYLPVYRLNVIQKHSAAGESVALDRLGSQHFQKTKERVKEAVRKLAVDLVQLYAQRKIRTGFRFSTRDAAFEEFESGFPFEETPDQSKAIDDILQDMHAGRIMDRLVCGDVGYGKTEVAIRAAYRAVCDGKQVAILVPTTLLAHQHEQSFKSRMADLPVVIESLSRFKATREQKKVLTALSEGRVDILIGTHRLLSKDVSFRDLGLLIVDEEHRFGVDHKEKLKALKVNVPVITLTATPIPRTLNMALSGLREISLIRTPPVNRLPIRTFISKREDGLIKKAIEFELTRGGQAFFLHNRVQSIFETASHLQSLVPQAKITVAHGQMSESELEKAITEFYEKRTNVLVCTSIIESGIDLPSANTILIDRADSFGLAQLYQIRGRVGRGQQRGYAYLLIPAETAISDDAKKRLDVIQRFVELGSGFSVASHDLEIRGGGELLGAQQSGNIHAVGFDLYLELLDEAVREIQNKGSTEPTESLLEPEIKTPFPAFLSEDYVPDVHQRLSLYRRLSACRDDESVDRLEEELRDRFGRVPEEAVNLLWLIRTKVHLKRLGIDAVTVGKERLVLIPGKSSKLDPVRAIALFSAYPDRYQITPDSKFVAKRSAGSMKELYFSIQDLLNDLTRKPSSNFK